MTVWKYRLDSDTKYRHKHFAGIEFSSEWGCIRDGRLTIYRGYAWDGCSYKYCVLGLFYIGTPDGPWQFGKPWLYDASLVHDVLCQYADTVPLTKQQVLDIFWDMMVESRWRWAAIYAYVVDHYGPKKFGADQKTGSTPKSLTYYRKLYRQHMSQG